MDLFRLYHAVLTIRVNRLSNNWKSLFNVPILIRHNLRLNLSIALDNWKDYVIVKIHLMLGKIHKYMLHGLPSYCKINKVVLLLQRVHVDKEISNFRLITSVDLHVHFTLHLRLYGSLFRAKYLLWSWNTLVNRLWESLLDCSHCVVNIMHSLINGKCNWVSLTIKVQKLIWWTICNNASIYHNGNLVTELFCFIHSVCS